MLGDLVTVARNRLADTRGAGESAYADRPVLPMGRPSPATTSRSTSTTARACSPRVALAFAENKVSIQTVRQEGRGVDAQLVVVSHEATDAQLSATADHLRRMDMVREVTRHARRGDAE